MTWTDAELRRNYPLPVWSATARAYSYVASRGHEAESQYAAWEALPPDEKQLWLQGAYEGLHEAAKAVAQTVLSRLLRLTL